MLNLFNRFFRSGGSDIRLAILSNSEFAMSLGVEVVNHPGDDLLALVLIPGLHIHTLNDFVLFEITVFQRDLCGVLELRRLDHGDGQFSGLRNGHFSKVEGLGVGHTNAPHATFTQLIG